jgi:hypothetical protein
VEAAERLLAGTAAASSGRLNVVALAEEAGLNRTSLYQRHPDLVTDFQTRAGLTPASPTTQAVQGQLDTARTRIAELEKENSALEQRIRTLSAIIAEMSLEADGKSNVVPLRRN